MTHYKTVNTWPSDGGCIYVHESYKPFNTNKDVRLMLDPTDQELKTIKPFNDNTSIEDILSEEDIFKSKGEARRNNFSGPIKQGFHVIRIGKNRKYVFIYNKTEGLEILR